MLVIVLCTACFSKAKINKKLWLLLFKNWPLYFKIWPLYFECSGAGTEGRQRGHDPLKIFLDWQKFKPLYDYGLGIRASASYLVICVDLIYSSSQTKRHKIWFSQLPCLMFSIKKGWCEDIGRQVRFLCPWARHLTGLSLPLSG